MRAGRRKPTLDLRRCSELQRSARLSMIIYKISNNEKLTVRRRCTGYGNGHSRECCPIDESEIFFLNSCWLKNVRNYSLLVDGSHVSSPTMVTEGPSTSYCCKNDRLDICFRFKLIKKMEQKSHRSHIGHAFESGN